MTVWPIHPDAEVECLMRLLDRGGWMPSEVTHIERAIRDRKAFVEAGVVHPTAQWWNPRLQLLDNRLRLRWDFKQGWTLDRFAQACWQVVGVFGFNYLRPWLIDYLKERDMQRWLSPEAYMEHKREQALKVRMANEYANTQKLLGVIDKMSDKQVKEFITVERAMQTGERITLHGASHRMLTRMAKASKRSPAPPTRSINPGQMPFRYARKGNGRHVREK